MLCTTLLALVLPVALAAEDKNDGGPAGLEFFEKNVRPALVEHCYKCHSTEAKKLKGGLLVDSRQGLLKGGDSGIVLVPGEPGKSRLIEAIGYKNVDLRMPPRGKLADAVIKDLTSWVRRGAPWPAANAPNASTIAGQDFNLEERKRRHWAWRPVGAQSPPTVKDRTWPRTPMDRFVLAKLEGRGLAPAPAADRRTLMRRLSFDLVGLPPTSADVEAFVNDRSADACEKLVDRLLASPHFGERWARHWMDLVRYAESRGHEFDYVAPNAYQYRDYLIRAYNADVPYDQFVREHIAGDLLARPRQHPAEGFNESILASGFWFLGEEVHSPVDVRQDQADRFDNRIDVLGKTFLGLTVACARCHDHKFDAISTKDYYALFGVIESSSYRLACFDSMEHNRRIALELAKLREQSRPALQRALADALRPGVEQLGGHLLAAAAALKVDVAGECSYEKQAAIAQTYAIDTAALAIWARMLQNARRDEQDPLFAFVTAADVFNKRPSSPGKLPKAALSSLRENLAGAAPAATEVVADYGKLDPANWMPDGVAFGPGPVRPGDVRYGDSASRPIINVFDQCAAEKDPTWDRLHAAAGVQHDAEALGRFSRAGRTLRTPSFTLTEGKLYYLARGSGIAYAAVAQHGLIAGPLHAQIITAIKAGTRFQWIEHDLTPYKGQYVHVEFTPAEHSDLGIAMVVQSAQAPGRFTSSCRAVPQLLEGRACQSLEALAAEYQRLFLEALDRFARDGILGASDATEQAQLANWLIRRQELFVVPESAQEKSLAWASAPFIAAQQKLIAQIKTESRLAMAIRDGNGRDERVFIRGSPKTLGERVPRRFLEALAGTDPLPDKGKSGRKELAEQMTDPARNPFLARVMVNRIWHHLFGRGIVASVDNFGALGEPPTHPELLDYLADRFVHDGWSIKKLIGALVLSSTYRMSSRPDGAADQLDPQNLLLHRMRLRRLEGESIRDAMLALSGELDASLYGPSVPVRLTAFQDGRGRPPSGPLDGLGRRSIYLAVRRNFLSPLLLAFDTPIPFSTVGRRMVSNVPAQSLILMNDPFVHQQAEAWARRVLSEPGSAADRVHAMYRAALCRPPTESELRACLRYLERQSTLVANENGPHAKDDVATWKDLAHVLLNAKEFIFLH